MPLPTWLGRELGWQVGGTVFVGVFLKFWLVSRAISQPPTLWAVPCSRRVAVPGAVTPVPGEKLPLEREGPDPFNWEGRRLARSRQPCSLVPRVEPGPAPGGVARRSACGHRAAWAG